MPDPLSPDTRARIDGFCRQISIERGLDDEIRAELAAHMEDKLIAYLSGAEKITEEDAFVLVREHFGDPEDVKAMLENVHAEKPYGNLARCLGAIVAVTIGGRILHFLLESLYFSLFFGVFKHSFPDMVRILAPVPFYLVQIGVPVLSWFILYRWQKASSGRERPWFVTIGPVYFLALLVSLVFMVIIIFQTVFSPLLRQFVPVMSHSLGYRIISDGHSALHSIRAGIEFLGTFFSASAGLFLWLWWFGRVSRRFLMPLFVFILWGMFKVLMILPNFILIGSIGLTSLLISNIVLPGGIALCVYLIYAGTSAIMKKRLEPAAA